MNDGKPARISTVKGNSWAILCQLWVSTCIICFVLTGCKDAEKSTAPPADATPIQKLNQFSTQHTEGGILKWTLVGDAAAAFHQDFVEVENPTVEIFEDGHLSIRLTSKKGIHFLTGAEKDNLHLSGDVAGTSEDGQLYTQELHWWDKSGLLYAPNQATVVRGDSTWVGVKMKANPTLETVKMENNTFRLYPKDENTDGLE